VERQRKILVTGVSSSLGLSVAQKFLEKGCLVFGTSRTLGMASQLDQSAPELQRGFRFIACDLTTDAEVDKLTQALDGSSEHLDGLIHIAGGTRTYGEFSSIATDEWLNAYDLNVVSVQRLLVRLLPSLRVGQDASIVLVGSSTAEEPGAWNPHYSAAKAALMNLSKHLAVNLAADGIRVNYLALGPTDSGQWATDSGETSVRLRERSSPIPLGRLGTPAEVADLISCIDSSFLWMTGSRIRLDGGKNKGI
jgi:3-oxoacyl-[acyl-carrier protein] reductase